MGRSSQTSVNVVRNQRDERFRLAPLPKNWWVSHRDETCWGGRA